MTDIMDLLSDINDIAKLREIKAFVSNRLDELDTKKEIEGIKYRMEGNCYDIFYKEYEIPNVLSFPLKFYVKTKAYDKEDKSDAEICDSWDREDQDEWYKAIGYDGPYTENFVDYCGEWNGSDWDDPIYCKAYIHVFLYYSENQKILAENKEFDIIFEEDGKYLECEIKNEKIFNKKTNQEVDLSNSGQYCIIQRTEEAIAMEREQEIDYVEDGIISKNKDDK